MFSQGTGEINTFDITDVGHIERIVVGSTTPNTQPTEQDTQRQMALINRCLSEYPKGRIIGVERSFSLIRIGEHQVVLESVAYHIGFKKMPLWMEQDKSVEPSFSVDPGKIQNIIDQHS